MIRLEMKKYKTTLAEKQIVSALSSGEVDTYEYLIGEEILPFDQSKITEQAKLTYSSLGKALEKQIKTIEEQGRKQVEVLKVLNPDESQQDLKSVESLFQKR